MSFASFCLSTLLMLPAAAVPPSQLLREAQAELGLLKSLAEARTKLLAIPDEALPPSQSSPHIAPDWISAVAFWTTENASDLDHGPRSFSRWVQEASHKRRATHGEHTFTIAPAAFVGTPKEWFNYSSFETPHFYGWALNGNGMASDGPADDFSDIFAFMPSTRDCGETSYKSAPVRIWCFRTEKDDVKHSVAVLIDAGGLPVLIDQNTTTSSGKNQYIRYWFHEFQPGAVDPEFWSKFNQTAFLHPPTCPAVSQEDSSSFLPALMTTTMFIFHPADNFDIAGQDLASELGDTVFVCNAVLDSPHAPDNYSWLTKWEVEHVPVWGQYQNCDGYPPHCSSREHFYVGHEAAYYIGSPAVLERQCRPNPLMGEWYSLPVGGECKDGEVPGRTCSWRKVRRVKTIEGACLLRHEFRTACQAGARAPFPAARAKFQAAFFSDKEAEGGCPPLPGSFDAESIALI